MSDLVSAEQLGEHFKRSPSAIEAALRKLGVKGSGFRMNGVDFDVWPKVEAIAALDKHFFKEQPVVMIDLAPVLERIGAMESKLAKII